MKTDKHQPSDAGSGDDERKKEITLHLFILHSCFFFLFISKKKTRIAFESGSRKEKNYYDGE